MVIKACALSCMVAVCATAWSEDDAVALQPLHVSDDILEGEEMEPLEPIHVEVSATPNLDSVAGVAVRLRAIEPLKAAGDVTVHPKDAAALGAAVEVATQPQDVAALGAVMEVAMRPRDVAALSSTVETVVKGRDFKSMEMILSSGVDGWTAIRGDAKPISVIYVLCKKGRDLEKAGKDSSEVWAQIERLWSEVFAKKEAVAGSSQGE